MDSVQFIPDAPNWLFSTCAFIGFVLCMIPLPWHLEAWNTGTCLYMIWTGLACLISFINTIVWSSDVINRAPAWCDISAHFLVASSVALPAATLCITRRLYKIACVQNVTTTRAEKRHDIMVDLAIGVGLPIVVMILHSILVQPNRYIIIEEVGCYPSTLNTPLAYVLYFSWPVIIGLVSATYGIRTIRELAIRRAQFKEFLATNRNLSSSRYFRLMGLAGFDVLCTIPLGSYVIYVNTVATPVQAYGSWASAHADFGTIVQIPAVIWRANSLSTFAVETRWFIIMYAFVFFGFFGFADEARKNYRLAYVSVAKRVGLSTGSISTTGTWTANGTNPDMSYNSRCAAMPVIITRQKDQKRDSLASFSSRMSLPDYGGALTDVKKMPFSPTATSSGSMSKESLPRSPVDLENVPLPALPEATLDTNEPPRYTHDAPNRV